jgi:hypothetical protein
MFYRVACFIRTGDAGLGTLSYSSPVSSLKRIEKRIFFPNLPSFIHMGEPGPGTLSRSSLALLQKRFDKSKRVMRLATDMRSAAELRSSPVP